MLQSNGWWGKTFVSQGKMKKNWRTCVVGSLAYVLAVFRSTGKSWRFTGQTLAKISLYFLKAASKLTSDEAQTNDRWLGIFILTLSFGSGNGETIIAQVPVLSNHVPSIHKYYRSSRSLLRLMIRSYCMAIPPAPSCWPVVSHIPGSCKPHHHNIFCDTNASMDTIMGSGIIISLSYPIRHP